MLFSRDSQRKYISLKNKKNTRYKNDYSRKQLKIHKYNTSSKRNDDQ